MSKCIACKQECPDGYAIGRLCYKCIEETVVAFISQKGVIRRNEFAGLVIKDFYCNGFFGRDYDLEDSEIIENTERYLTIRKENGKILQADMDGWDMRNYVNQWTSKNSADE